MSIYKRCTSCNGSKRVLGGGLIMKDCDVCDGRGMMEVIDDVNELSSIAIDSEPSGIGEEVIPKIKRKPGRPKREITYVKENG